MINMERNQETKQLYLDDSYKKEFDAVIIDVVEKLNHSVYELESDANKLEQAIKRFKVE